MSLPSPYLCLITDDGSSTVFHLAHSLRQKDWQVVVLSFPPSLLPEGGSLPTEVHRVVLEDFSEAHLQQQLETISATYGLIGTFIHLHPRFPVTQTQDICYHQTDKSVLQQVFLMAKYLKSSLNEAAHSGRSSFITAARLDGAFGLSDQSQFSVIPAGLFGLTKSLNQEWSKVFCRAIDLSPALSAEVSAQRILAELHDPNLTITEVAYGSQGRTTLIGEAR